MSPSQARKAEPATRVGGVRVELTYLARDDAGRLLVPLRDQNVLWSKEPLGNEVRELQGVRARVIALPVLRTGKSSPRDDPDEAAKDRADFHALSRLAPSRSLAPPRRPRPPF